MEKEGEEGKRLWGVWDQREEEEENRVEKGKIPKGKRTTRPVSLETKNA